VSVHGSDERDTRAKVAADAPAKASSRREFVKAATAVGVAALLPSSARGDTMARQAGSAEEHGWSRVPSILERIKPPRFDPNRILLNELVITGAFVYDKGGFVQALELLASGKLANDLLVEQEDYPLNRLLDTALGLHEGTVAAKAMIVPRVE